MHVFMFIIMQYFGLVLLLMFTCLSSFPSVWTLCFSSCLFKTPLMNTQSALIGQLTHAWTSIVNNSRAAVLNVMYQTSYHMVEFFYVSCFLTELMGNAVCCFTLKCSSMSLHTSSIHCRFSCWSPSPYVFRTCNLEHSRAQLSFLAWACDSTKTATVWICVYSFDVLKTV